MGDTDDNPTRLGDYELLTRLATGGMAEIFLARQSSVGGLERLVVIKRIKREYAEDPSFTEMFLREARIVARINDPNVVRIFELGEQEGDYFISMEYIHGLTVAELIKQSIRQNTWLSIGSSAAIMEQACKGLHQVHEVCDLDGNHMGLIHRDVSHQNFICTEDGFVKLIDFGIAKSTESAEEATYSGSVKGKYAYMSPEQCAREELDRRSDIFSLGVVAWELFAGRRLFKRQDKLETIEAITQQEPPPPSSANDRVPARIDRVVMRALEKDPTARYQTAESFRSALLDAARTEGVDVGTDRLGDYVTRVGGDAIEDRRRERRRAVDDHAESDVRDQLAMGGLETDDTERRSTTKAILHQAGMQAPIVLLVGAIALLAVTGWYVWSGGSSPDSSSASPTGTPVRIGWPPIIEDTVIDEETAPIWSYLGREISRPIELEHTATYDALADKIRSNELHFGMMPPLLYVQTKQKAPDIRPLAVREFDGATSVDGVLLVLADSGLSTLADLEGKRVCLTDRDSTTGNFLPRAHLRQQGYEPEQFFGPIQWSGSHARLLRDLLAGRCDAGATSSASLVTAGEFGIAAGQFRTLTVTGHVPQDVLVASADAPTDLADQLRTALLDFDPQTIGDKSYISDKMKITGFAPIDDEAYSDLREALATQDE